MSETPATKVYVLFNGCYSDTRVVGIYTSAPKAELASRIFRDDASIEEFELDSRVDEMLRGCVPFFVRLDRNSGDVTECHAQDSSYGAFSSAVGEDVHKNLYTHCWASSREAAIKIASERRRMFLAQASAEVTGTAG